MDIIYCMVTELKSQQLMLVLPSVVKVLHVHKSPYNSPGCWDDWFSCRIVQVCIQQPHVQLHAVQVQKPTGLAVLSPGLKDDGLKLCHMSVDRYSLLVGSMNLV